MFCDDCLNSLPPNPEYYYKQKYGYCTTSKHLASFGTGIYLYFYYIKFIIYMCLLILGVEAIYAIVIARKYNQEVANYCQLELSYTSNSSTVCEEYNSVFHDWLYSMNFENLSNVYLIIHLLIIN